MVWLDLLVVQGTLKSLLQYHNSKTSILLCSAVQLSHPYMTTGKTIALTRRMLEISFEKDIASSADVSPDNDDYIIIEDKKLDVLPSVEEQIMLEMPSKTLCKEDCRGLCYKCGKNLNEGDCSCEKHEVDPRLAILKTLLK